MVMVGRIRETCCVGGRHPKEASESHPEIRLCRVARIREDHPRTDMETTFSLWDIKEEMAGCRVRQSREREM